MKWPLVIGISLILAGFLLKNTTEMFIGNTVDMTGLNATILLRQAFDDATTLINTINIAALKAKASTAYEQNMVESTVSYLKNFLKYVPTSPTAETVDKLQDSGMNVILVSNTVISYVNTLQKLKTSYSDKSNKLTTLYTDAGRTYEMCKGVLKNTPSIKTTEPTMKAILNTLEDLLVNRKSEYMTKLAAYDYGITPGQQMALEQDIYELTQKVAVLFYLIKTSPNMFPVANQLRALTVANTPPPPPKPLSSNVVFSPRAAVPS